MAIALSAYGDVRAKRRAPAPPYSAGVRHVDDDERALRGAVGADSAAHGRRRSISAAVAAALSPTALATSALSRWATSTSASSNRRESP